MNHIQRELLSKLVELLPKVKKDQRAIDDISWLSVDYHLDIKESLLCDVFLGREGKLEELERIVNSMARPINREIEWV